MSRVRDLEKTEPVGPGDSHSSREVEEFDGLRRGQILSVRKACAKLFESRGLKQLPFGTCSLRVKVQS
jgi:hypothetical protein